MLKHDNWFLACHEFGHAAIHWHFGGFFDEGGVVIDTSTGEGRFHVFSCYTGNMIAEVLRNAHDEMVRALFIRSVELDLIRLLGGPVAEFIAHGWEPKRAIRFSSEYRFPDSDSYRIRDLLRGLTGKDDKQYQIRLQEECRAILTEQRTWRAVEHLATMLLESGKLSGPEIAAVVETFHIPRKRGEPRCAD